MPNQLSQIKWGRVILTTLVVYIFSFLTLFVVVTAYATSLAFQARGAPDQAMITAFANQNAPWIGPISLILFTVLGARHMARRVESAISLHGMILGALTGIVNMLFDGFGLGTFIIIILTISAGWLGSKLGARK
jgi:hypothetical protein